MVYNWKLIICRKQFNVENDYYTNNLLLPELRDFSLA